MIIGLSGYARSGKDETAKILVEQYGYKQLAFADVLRDMLYAINPLVSVDPYSIVGSNGVVEGYKWTYVKEVIDEFGWGGYKETPYGTEIRRLLQRLGTEAGRQTLWDSIWIDATLHDVRPTDRIVVSDARFFNEFDAVRERGGEVWRIERPGVGPANDHASEMEAVNYPHFAAHIDNDGTLEDLAKKIGRLI